MPTSIKSIIARGCLSAVMVATAACSPRHAPALSVTDLMEDRVLLDGVLMKCNRDAAKARTDTDCLNARVAIERLARQDEPAQEAKRQEDFERNREQLRELQEKQDRQREQQEARTKVDAYHLPVMPVDPTPPPKDPQSPIVGQTSH